MATVDRSSEEHKKAASGLQGALISCVYSNGVNKYDPVKVGRLVCGTLPRCLLGKGGSSVTQERERPVFEVDT